MPAYISEVSHDGGSKDDFIEIAVESGTDISGYSVSIYDDIGNVVSTFSLGSIQSTSFGKDVYLIDDSVAGFFDIGNKDAVALVDDNGNVFSFLSFKGQVTTASDGPAAGATSQDLGDAG